MRYRVSHITRYESQEKVTIGMNQTCLYPRETPWQKCEHHRLMTSPISNYSDKRTDYYGNQITHFSFERGYQKLEIRSISRVHVQPREYPAPSLTTPWNKLLIDLLQQPGKHHRAFEMQAPSSFVCHWTDDIKTYAAKSFPPNRPLLEGLLDLLARFRADFEFDNTATSLNTPIAQVMENRKGVCQDFAHLMLAMLRSLEIPARYVSGYLRTHPPEGQKKLRGSDASHAWVAVFAGELGWVDIDPTNNCLVSDEHITVGWGRDYYDVAPVKGVIIGTGSHQLEVEVDVDELTGESST